MYNYGECEVCAALLQEKNIQQEFWLKDKLVIIENVPAGVCPRCGEKVVNADVGEHIARLLGNSSLIENAPTVCVPLISYEVAQAV